MCGLAFSGKSTLARKIADYTDSKLVSFDKLWVEKQKEIPTPKNVKGWRYIRDIAKTEISTSLQSGQSVVFDDTNPRREHRDEFRIIATKMKVACHVIYLNTPFAVIKTRQEMNKIEHNRHEVEPVDFDKVINDLEIPTADENTLIFTPEIASSQSNLKNMLH